jgi:hypothetical protein
MLLVRIDQSRAFLPVKLSGIVQLEILTKGGETEFYHLLVDGTKTKGAIGLAKDHDVWVNTTESDLEQLVHGEEVEGALRAQGRVELFTDLLDAIQKQGGPTSLLGLRGKKS